jgi:hypothetical protein
MVAASALGAPRTVYAQAAARSPTATLAAAERAYQDVDFEQAFALGSSALSRGGATLDESARLYTLLGVSAAALGKTDEARRYFCVAIAIDPERSLDRGLSPKIRAPYLEAQGALSMYKRALLLSAKPKPEAQRLAIHLEDPLGLVRRIQVLTKTLRTAAFSENSLAKSGAVPVPAALWQSGFEYVVRGVDEAGNTLCELGTEPDPVLVSGAHGARGAAPGEEPAASGRTTLSWLPWALGSGGLVALAAGGYFQVRREQAASKWNSPSCEHPGATRWQQCASVDDDRRRAQTLAIGFSGAGGALLVGGAITYFLTRGSGSAELRTSQFACGTTGSLWSCSGQF